MPRSRHGDVETLRRLEADGLERPKGSIDLDNVSLDDSKNLIFDHCSLSWCCDEAFGIVGCENVTIQWCLIAEPLANPRLHPYGDRHAFGLNTSANKLSVHHCLVAHYVMRGPQFEANDVRRTTGYDVQMEAVNNLLFDYERSGSRYTTGIEDHPEEAVGTKFEFQFVNNYYLNPVDRKPEIEAVLKHGVSPQVRVYVAGNVGPHRPQDAGDQLAVVFTETRQPIAVADAAVRAQYCRRSPLLTADSGDSRTCRRCLSTRARRGRLQPPSRRRRSTDHRRCQSQGLWADRQVSRRRGWLARTQMMPSAGTRRDFWKLSAGCDNHGTLP